MAEYNPGANFQKSSSFGERRDPFNLARSQYHTGIDFEAAVGTAIPAASDGAVVYSAFNQGGFGYTVIIKSIGQDGTPYYTLYAHMNGNTMPAYGTSVTAGDVIGQVGNTGRSTGPHLHFEVLRGDSGVNESGDGGGIGFRTSDAERRHNPEAFDNWYAGEPYGAENPPAQPPDHNLYNPNIFYASNINSLYEIGKFIPRPRGGADEEQADSFTVDETTRSDGTVLKSVYDADGNVVGVYTLDQDEKLVAGR
jgi:murein DD-endopeptidase MepM/ murein hydrolase activator NlpD